jgi:hypothetical protein
VLDREVLTEYGKLAASPADLDTDCKSSQPFIATSGKQRLSAVVARLPGEARYDDAFFAVYLEQQPPAAGPHARSGRKTTCRSPTSRGCAGSASSARWRSAWG